MPNREFSLKISSKIVFTRTAVCKYGDAIALLALNKISSKTVFTRTAVGDHARRNEEHEFPLKISSKIVFTRTAVGKYGDAIAPFALNSCAESAFILLKKK